MERWSRMTATKATAVLAGILAAGLPLNVMTTQTWNLENGQYVDVSGTPVVGALVEGITVTKYQNRINGENGIDWEKVAADGISFAMVHVGYYKDKDPYFDRSVTKTAASGIKVGVFLRTQVLNVQAAEGEANFILKVIKDLPISYPIAYNVESQRFLGNNLSRQQVTDNVDAFCKAAADASYHPVAYANNEWLTKNMDTSQIPYGI